MSEQIGYESLVSEAGLTIDGVEIGPGHRTYVIAEISANHRHSQRAALEIVEAAAHAGADAVKLQTYRPDTITIDVRTGPFVVGPGSLWSGRSLFDLYQQAMTPWEWHGEIMQRARSLGLSCFSTPFDESAIDFLEGLDVPAYKIASFELIDHGLIAAAARTGKPVIMSTGMATAEEINEAVVVARHHGDGGLALLRCNSTYPAPLDQMDLATIADMRSRWGVTVGLSDHTMTDTTALVAVALGARIVEKHITLRRSDGGPDGAFSLEPDEFARMVASIRDVERSLGTVRYGPTRDETNSHALRRSLYAVADIAPGETIAVDKVRSIRPAGGLDPKHLPDVVGRTAAVAIARGTPISWELLV